MGIGNIIEVKLLNLLLFFRPAQNRLMLTYSFLNFDVLSKCLSCYDVELLIFWEKWCEHCTARFVCVIDCVLSKTRRMDFGHMSKVTVTVRVSSLKIRELEENNNRKGKGRKWAKINEHSHTRKYGHTNCQNRQRRHSGCNTSFWSFGVNFSSFSICNCLPWNPHWLAWKYTLQISLFAFLSYVIQNLQMVGTYFIRNEN